MGRAYTDGRAPSSHLLKDVKQAFETIRIKLTYTHVPGLFISLFSKLNFRVVLRICGKGLHNSNVQNFISGPILKHKS